MKLKQLREEFKKKDARLQALLSQESLSAEEQTELAQLDAACEDLKVQIEQANSVDEIRKRNLARQEWAGATPAAAANPAAQNAGAAAGAELANATKDRFAIPAHVVRSKVTSFSDREGLSKERRAFAFGNWLLATSRGNRRAQQFCLDHGVPLVAVDKAGQVIGNMVGAGGVIKLGHTEIVNSQGGFLVPPEFEQDFIDLRERFGKMRGLLRNRPMGSDTRLIPKRTGGVTAYWVGEGSAITESNKAWGQVGLVAKKLAVLTRASSELQEDAIIDVGNDLAEEISYAFATAEDDAAINGDGSLTYGRVTGIRTKLQDVDGSGTDGAGLVTASGNAWSEITLADHNFAKAKLPEYANNERTRWLVSQQYWAGVMERLALAAGGITDAMIAAGYQPRFLGFPVVISQKMPTVEGNSSVAAILGDFYAGGSFGDRRQTTIAVSEHAAFETDETMIRGTERVDINIHDVGDATTPGPIVGLQTAAA